MIGTGSRSPFVPVGAQATPGVGAYTITFEPASLPPAFAAAPFMVTSQRSDMVPPSSRGGAHAYAAQASYAPPPPGAAATPPFGGGGARSDVGRPSSRGVPGPGAYHLLPVLRASPLHFEQPHPRRTPSPSPSPSPPRARASPTVPYAVAHGDTPGPGEYAPRAPTPASPGANLLFSLSRAPRASPLEVNAPGGPGSSGNPMLPADTGAAYKAGTPLSTLVRPYSPAVEALGRGASLRLPTRDNPGPGTYLGPWGASGFVAAGARTPEGQPQVLGTRASRSFVVGAPAPPHPGAPSPASYTVARPLGSGSGSGSSGNFLGGGEARFRLPPDERAARETPGPGAYSPRARPSTPAQPSPAAAAAAAAFHRLRAASQGASSSASASSSAISPALRASLHGGAAHLAAWEAFGRPGSSPLTLPPPTSASRPASPIAPAVLAELYGAAVESPASARAAAARARSREAARERSPGPIYDTRGSLAPGGANVVAGAGALMGLGAGRARGGGLPDERALGEAAGLGPGSYSLRREPGYGGGRGAPVNAALGAPLERGFGVGGRSALGGAGALGSAGGEFGLVRRAWAWEASFNARERESLARMRAHGSLAPGLPR